MNKGSRRADMPLPSARNVGPISVLFGGLVSLSCLFGVMGTASAAPACPSIYIFNSANGTESYPGTSVGMVGMGAGFICQIGAVDPPASSTSAALINTGVDPSNYEFQWGGGDLTVGEEIGASSYGNADAELYSWDASDSTKTLIPGTSVEITGNPSSPSGEVVLLNNQYLAAGDYIVSTYCAEDGCVAGDGTAVDPQFQVNFTVPEPASLPLLAAGLIGLAVVRRRLRANAHGAARAH